MFEAGMFAQIRDTTQQLGVHTDILNDDTATYEKMGIISFIVIDCNDIASRVTVIGYNRRCCGQWMTWLFDA